MTLASHVATLGRGPGRSRSLTQAEAWDAMALMLSGDAAPEAVGALLMLLRMKGETADEIAGFAGAAQDRAPALPPVDLDWPSYAAGRTRGVPWFLLAARLVAQNGHRVLIHGENGTDATVRAHLPTAGIATAQTPSAIGVALEHSGIAYAPLDTLSQPLCALLRLRPILGLRSCINTVCRMWNPARAGACVQGVFHPSYRLLQADAAARLGQHSLAVIKGGGGEFERHPGKSVQLFGLRSGAVFDDVLPASADYGARRLAEVSPGTDLARLWAGEVQDPFAEDIVIGTAALALSTLGVANPDTRARDLWAHRNAANAA